MDEQLNLTELVPVMKPGSRGLFHLSVRDTQRMDYPTRKALYGLLAEAAEKAGVELMARISNRMMLIGWTPK